jgi:hypothetical protein
MKGEPRIEAQTCSWHPGQAHRRVRMCQLGAARGARTTSMAKARLTFSPSRTIKAPFSLVVSAACRHPTRVPQLEMPRPTGDIQRPVPRTCARIGVVRRNCRVRFCARGRSVTHGARRERRIIIGSPHSGVNRCLQADSTAGGSEAEAAWWSQRRQRR